MPRPRSPAPLREETGLRGLHPRGGLVASAAGSATHAPTASAPATRERSHQQRAPPSDINAPQIRIQRTWGLIAEPISCNTTSKQRTSDTVAMPASTSDTAAGRSRRVAQAAARATHPALLNRTSRSARSEYNPNPSTSTATNTSTPPTYAIASAARPAPASSDGAGSASNVVRSQLLHIPEHSGAGPATRRFLQRVRRPGTPQASMPLKPHNASAPSDERHDRTARGVGAAYVSRVRHSRTRSGGVDESVGQRLALAFVQ